eukprot:ANDGO_02067.mRNA.1 hypothetical protein GUITHDRAFT_109763
MVVRGLLEHVQNKDESSMELIDVAQFAPIGSIVVDAPSVIEYLWPRTFSLFDASFGGNYMAFVAAFRSFVEQLQAATQATEIAFFFDSVPEEFRFDEVVDQYKRSVSVANNVPSTICSQKSMIIKGSTIPSPALAYSVALWILSAYPFVKVFQSLDGEIDAAASAYALLTGSFAVISNDSDFLVHNVPFMPLNSMLFPFLKRFCSKEVAVPVPYLAQNSTDCIAGRLYKPNAAAGSLGLDQWMLPYFACLIGCDYVKREHGLELIVNKVQNLMDTGYQVGAIAEYLPSFTKEALSGEKLAQKFLSASNLSESFRQEFIKAYENGLAFYTRTGTWKPAMFSRHVHGLTTRHILFVPPVFSKGPAERFSSERFRYIRQALCAQWDSLFGSANMPLSVLEIHPSPSGVGQTKLLVGARETEYRPLYDLFIQELRERKDVSRRVEPRLEQLLFTVLNRAGSASHLSALRGSSLYTALVSESLPMTRFVRLVVVVASMSMLLSVEELFALSVYSFHLARLSVSVTSRYAGASIEPKQWTDDEIADIDSRMYETSSVLQSVLWHLCLVNEAMSRPLKYAPEELSSGLDTSGLARILVRRQQGYGWLDLNLPDISVDSVGEGVMWLRQVAKDLRECCSLSIFQSSSDVLRDINAIGRSKKRSRKDSEKAASASKKPRSSLPASGSAASTSTSTSTSTG